MYRLSLGAGDKKRELQALFFMEYHSLFLRWIYEKSAVCEKTKKVKPDIDEDMQCRYNKLVL